MGCLSHVAPFFRPSLIHAHTNRITSHQVTLTESTSTSSTTSEEGGCTRDGDGDAAVALKGEGGEGGEGLVQRARRLGKALYYRVLHVRWTDRRTDASVSQPDRQREGGGTHSLRTHTHPFPMPCHTPCLD